jgi:lambda family phage portal protein
MKVKVNGKAGFFKRAKAAAQMLFGYDAVKQTRNRKNRGLTPLREEEIELNSHDRDKLISTLMNFKRNNPVVKAISRLRKTDIVGAGINPQPQTNDQDFNATATALWREWAKYPEVTNSMDMATVQKEIIDSTLFYGDIGVLLTRSGHLQLLEGNRIGNDYSRSVWTEQSPDKNGVIINKQGRPVSYKVGERVNGMLQNTVNIPARNMILFFKRIRPSQWRGVPELASAVNALQDLDEYETIEMISAKVSASLSAVVKKEGAAQFEIVDRMNPSEQDTAGRLQRFEPGTFHYLEPGESIETISAGGRPNVDGIDWCIYKLRQVGASVGVPVEMILATIGESSFSASQGLVLQYQGAVEEDQRALTQVLDRIWQWKIKRWIADGKLPMPKNESEIFNVRWQLPAFRWINRVAQVASDAKYLQMGALTLDDVASQFGETAEAQLRRKAQNILTAKQLAEEFNLDSYLELMNFYNVNTSANYADISSAAAADQEEQDLL